MPADLASQPTLSRFENRANAKDLRRLSDGLLKLYLKTHPGPRKVIVLDMDATDDPTHGKQQLSFFHGYYEEHMYHPLLVFDGRDGFPLAAVLRPGNTHSSHGALAVLKRLIKKLKQAYPKALILFRADAGFAVPALYRYLEEQQEIRYVIGFITNNRLLAKTAPAPGKGPTAVPGDGGETAALHLLQLPGGILGPAPPHHRQGGIHPSGRQSALCGHQPGAATPSSFMTTSTCSGATWKTASRN